MPLLPALMMMLLLLLLMLLMMQCKAACTSHKLNSPELVDPVTPSSQRR